MIATKLLFCLFGLISTLGGDARQINLNGLNGEIDEGLVKVDVNPNIVPAIVSSIEGERREDLFEGDIVLTDEEWEVKRGKKFVKDEKKWWPKNEAGVTMIDYRFSASIQDPRNQTVFREAVKLWEDNTCVKFREVSDIPQKPHLIVVDGEGCNTHVGVIVGKNGQPVTLEKSKCFTGGPGTTAHELGHSLGLHHEQGRSDRDKYIKVFYENIDPKMAFNFNRENTNNFNMPYDFSSIMHYDGDGFSLNNKRTMATKDLSNLPLIGQRGVMSFMDIKIVNLVYGCIKKWTAACPNSNPCQNRGYMGPDCKCRCPAGTDGDGCVDKEMSYTDAVKKKLTPYSSVVTTDGAVITSPNFPKQVNIKTKALTLIRAPACQKVQLNFQLFSLLEDLGGGCTNSGVEVMTDPPNKGEIFCGTKVTPGKKIESVGNEMAVFFISRNDQRAFAGYKASVKFIPNTACSGGTTKKPTKPEPAAITLSNSNNRVIRPAGDSVCTLYKYSNPGEYGMASPYWPNPYSGGVKCRLQLKTDEPAYLEITPGKIEMGDGDQIAIMPPMQGFGLSSGNWSPFTLSSASAVLRFTASAASTGHKFMLRMKVKTSECHKIVEIPENGEGNLNIPSSYPAGQPCEWWLKAPQGKRILLHFNKFDVGNDDCQTGFLASSTSGDKSYKRDIVRNCGKFRPSATMSIGNEMTVLVYRPSQGTFGEVDIKVSLL